MAFFQSSEELYACAQSLFERLQQCNPAATDSVARSRLLIRLNCIEPAGEILINGRRKPVMISYSSNKIRPEIDVSLKADTLHSILLGELTVPKALSSKQMKVRGPSWKTLALADLFFQSQSLYHEILSQRGMAVLNTSDS